VVRELIDVAPHRGDPVRLELLAAAEAALAAVAPEEAVARAVAREGPALVAGGRRVDLGGFDRAVVLGFGKAAVPMGTSHEPASRVRRRKRS
jgi:glycerate 2-kinase